MDYTGKICVHKSWGKYSFFSLNDLQSVIDDQDNIIIENFNYTDLKKRPEWGQLAASFFFFQETAYRYFYPIDLSKRPSLYCNWLGDNSVETITVENINQNTAMQDVIYRLSEHYLFPSRHLKSPENIVLGFLLDGRIHRLQRVFEETLRGEIDNLSAFCKKGYYED